MSSTRIIAALLRKLAAIEPLRRWIFRLGAEFKSYSAGPGGAPTFDLPELTPIQARASSEHLRRLNLLVPALSSRHLFGGIQTALDVLELLRPHFDCVRIIVTEEAAPQLSENAFYSQWSIVSLGADGGRSDHIVPAGDRWNRTLSVGCRDYFMATAWWTAYAANGLLEWQMAEFQLKAANPLLYLIQDYEPGFYPWSAKYALAKSTYQLQCPTVAVINSIELSDYLAQQGHVFFRSHVLQPRINSSLARIRNGLEVFSKERLLLVYGRPGTERNAFPVIVAALKLWASGFAAASQWKVLAAGEAFEKIDLGGGCELCSLGKLTIEKYAETLSSAAIGVSLMVSPHPSYPPLEMAAFGVHTITNTFANKNLDYISSFMHALDNLNPVHLAAAISQATANFDVMSVEDRRVFKHQIDWNNSYLSLEQVQLDPVKVAADILGAG